MEWTNNHSWNQQSANNGGRPPTDRLDPLPRSQHVPPRRDEPSSNPDRREPDRREHQRRYYDEQEYYEQQHRYHHPEQRLSDSPNLTRGGARDVDHGDMLPRGERERRLSSDNDDVYNVDFVHHDSHVGPEGYRPQAPQPRGIGSRYCDGQEYYEQQHRYRHPEQQLSDSPSLARGGARDVDHDDRLLRGERERRLRRDIGDTNTVDFVHHDSPVGPAVSMNPKGYDWEQTEGYRPQAPQSRGPGSHYQEGPPRNDRSKFDESGGSSHNSFPSKSRITTVEISPGVRVKIRGAAETKECVRRDFFMPCVCFSCSLEMFCIQDAAYVLCPKCRVVSPLEQVDDELCEGGLGLGFTIDDLASIQDELIAQAQQQRGEKLY